MTTPGETNSNRPVRVLFDGYYLDSKRGMGRYVREVVDALGRHAPDVDLEVLVPRGTSFRLHADRIRYRVAPAAPFPLWEQIIVPAVAALTRADVVHSPYNTFPILHAWRRSQVITLHDMMYLNPEFRTMSARQDIGRIYRAAIVSRLKGTRIGVMTLTDTVASEIRDAFGIAADIHRTPVDYFVSQARETYAGAPERFALHVGGAIAHKNTARTVRAFRAARVPDCKLLVLGIAKDHALASEFAGEDVIFPGWLSDGEVLDLYDRALAVIFPSLMEGYGLPTLEGMACGCVIVTSNRNPMMELAGDAALIVDPLDETALAAAIGAAIGDAETRADLLKRGQERIDALGGGDLARSLAGVYQERRTSR